MGENSGEMDTTHDYENGHPFQSSVNRNRSTSPPSSSSKRLDLTVREEPVGGMVSGFVWDKKCNCCSKRFFIKYPGLLSEYQSDGKCFENHIAFHMYLQ